MSFLVRLCKLPDMVRELRSIFLRVGLVSYRCGLVSFLIWFCEIPGIVNELARLVKPPSFMSYLEWFGELSGMVW